MFGESSTTHTSRPSPPCYCSNDQAVRIIQKTIKPSSVLAIISVSVSRSCHYDRIPPPPVTSALTAHVSLVTAAMERLHRGRTGRILIDAWMLSVTAWLSVQQTVVNSSRLLTLPRWKCFKELKRGTNCLATDYSECVCCSFVVVICFSFFSLPVHVVFVSEQCVCMCNLLSVQIEEIGNRI